MKLGSRHVWWAGGALAFSLTAGACSGDDGGGGGTGSATLPPIATTSTLPPSTTLSLLDQSRFVTIEQGDILSEIAKEHDVSQDDLMAMNGITDPDAVYVGQVLELPVEATLPTTSGPTSLVTTTVAP